MAMNFGVDFSEEEVMVRDAARAFARDRLAPEVGHRDEIKLFPRSLVMEMAQMGFFAMKVPMEEGGSGTNNVGYVLAMAEIAKVDASACVMLASSNLSTMILAKHANAEQKGRWLPGINDGKFAPLTFALSEPHCGSDASALKTTAVRDGDEWVINGTKQWITSGDMAGLHVVFARTDPEKGSHGISCFVIEAGTPGMDVGNPENKMGQRASSTVPLIFEDCRVPDENLLGGEGTGYGIALSALGAGRVGIAALSLGVAEAGLEEGVIYARERLAFGRPISDFQNSQFFFADSRMELDQAWLMTLKAALALDRGERAAVESSMAKLWASETCGRIVDRMLQLHGGYGYVKDYTIERLYRDARITRIYEGTSEVQRIVIAREMLKT
jgi:alkylation response protein AidB-like acyl-CoA dehydrogenase